MIKLSIVAILLLVLTAMVQAGDFNGDGTDDVAIFRPESGLWAIRGVSRYYFGTSSDNPVEGDFDGDGTDDTVIFRPNTGLWAARYITRCYWGRRRDIPIGGSGMIPDPSPPPTPIAAPTPAPTGSPGTTGDVVINEIAWGGTIDGADQQWIELYNNGSSTVSLDGWKLENNSALWSISISGSYSISAGGYFVLATNAPSGVNASMTYSGKLMNSSGGHLVLADSSDASKDTVNCSSYWFVGGQGVSMERIDPAVSGSTVGNWNAAPSSKIYGSGSYGTPGAKNSQQVSRL